MKPTESAATTTKRKEQFVAVFSLQTWSSLRNFCGRAIDWNGTIKMPRRQELNRMVPPGKLQYDGRVFLTSSGQVYAWYGNRSFGSWYGSD